MPATQRDPAREGGQAHIDLAFTWLVSACGTRSCAKPGPWVDPGRGVRWWALHPAFAALFCTLRPLGRLIAWLRYWATHSSSPEVGSSLTHLFFQPQAGNWEFYMRPPRGASSPYTWPFAPLGRSRASPVTLIKREQPQIPRVRDLSPLLALWKPPSRPLLAVPIRVSPPSLPCLPLSCPVSDMCRCCTV